jgi:hypothetical protein
MIRKCNTTQSKLAYTPCQNIMTSDFIENEEEAYEGFPSECDSTNQELHLNILKIKECKKQTEACINDMHNTIKNQQSYISSLEKVIKEEREKNKIWRRKYH